MKEGVIFFVTLAVLPAFGVAQEDAARPASIQISLGYYACADPQDCVCVAITKEEQDSCPQCTKWEQKFLSRASSLDIQEDSFAYSVTGLPSNRQFLDLAARQVYGVSLPRRPDGFPVSAGQLYKNPDRYGWIELGPDDPKQGALAVWPDMGALVVGDQRRPGDEGLNQIKVLYPSHELEGELNVIRADYLKLGNPKYILPEAFVVEDLNVQEAPPE